MRLCTWSAVLPLAVAALFAPLMAAAAPGLPETARGRDLNAGIPRPHAAGFWTWGCDTSGACVAVNDAPAREAWFKAQVWGGHPPMADMRIEQDSAGCVTVIVQSLAVATPAVTVGFAVAVDPVARLQGGGSVRFVAPARQTHLFELEVSGADAGRLLAYEHFFLDGALFLGLQPSHRFQVLCVDEAYCRRSIVYDSVVAHRLDLVQQAFAGARLGRPAASSCDSRSMAASGGE